MPGEEECGDKNDYQCVFQRPIGTIKRVNGENCPLDRKDRGQKQQVSAMVGE